MKTGLITYNLKDRGREYRGQDRDYSKPENLQALVAGINAGSAQEKVKFRDMHGYYGHGVRQLFGLLPPESTFLDGKKVVIEPDLTTTHLKAYKDGTVEHEATFTQSEGGEAAWRMYQQKLGGFSSAINERESAFYGFDYVFEPNFTKNRGHTTYDGISDEGLSQIIEEYDNYVKGTFDRVSGIVSTYYREQSEDLGLTLDRVAQLESELKNSLLTLEDYKENSIRLTREDSGSSESIYDTAKDFLSDSAVSDALSDAGIAEEKLIEQPVRLSPLRRALIGHLTRNR